MNKKLVIFYLVTSFIWIFGINYLIHRFAPTPYFHLIEQSKEIFYVLVIGGTLYYFMNKLKELHASKQDERRISTLINSINEKMNMASQLIISEQQYKSLFEYNPDIVYMIDLNGNIMNLNPQFETITGYNRDKMIGQNIRSILPNRYKRFINKFLCSFAVDIKPIINELNLPHANGQILHLHLTSLPIIIDGKITGIIGYGRDVTSLRVAEERLRRAEKLSVVGELSASIVHEIRNPLTSLKGFVQLLQVDDKEHSLYYQIMLDELNRINHIVGELLLLAKPQHLKYTMTDIQKLLNDVILLLGTEASLYNIQINPIFKINQVLIECEPNQIKQLFINIIKNAIEASENDDMVSIGVNQLENNHVLITVQDRGCGISKERLKKIGEPFYSSKEKGTGLGLTVSFKIVQSHRGTIQFDSKKNQGTSVHITLPIKQEHSRFNKRREIASAVKE